MASTVTLGDVEKRVRDLMQTHSFASPPLTTAEIATRLLQPGERMRDLSCAIVLLASDRLKTYARQGAPVLRRVYGKTRTVRPWLWHHPDSYNWKAKQ